MKEKIYWIMLLCVMACLGIYGSSNMFSTEKAVAQAEFDQAGFRFSGNKVKGKAEGQGMLLTQKGNVYIGGFSKGRLKGWVS